MNNSINLKTEFTQDLEAFSKLDSWTPKSLQQLRAYLANFEKLPSYKKLLHTMIKFEDMYSPLYISGRKARYIPGYRESLEEENARRAEKRAQIYLNRRKLIKTVDQAGEKRIVVTSQGEKVFYTDYPLAKLRRKKWDNYWTIVMYDFPEKIRKYRDRLRRQLAHFGFGSPQISIFISPLPLQQSIQQLIEAEGFQRYVWVTRAKAVLGKSNIEIARSAWPVDLLNDLYSRLCRTFLEIKQEEGRVVFWKTCFLAVDSQDPYLPFELLPEPWWGSECRKFFKKASRRGMLKAILAGFAQFTS